MNDPFHSGERQVQEAAGVRGVALLNGRTVGDRISSAAHAFIAGLAYCVLGTIDARGYAWASIQTGRVGFAVVEEDGMTVRMQLRDTLPQPRWRECLAVGRPIGALFIDLGTRRRLRVSGIIDSAAGDEIAIGVRQANGLCSKYIQRRLLTPPSDVPVQRGVAGADEGTELSDDIITSISQADTAFVASGVPGASANVSHRGGGPGFIAREGSLLRVPDYPGNNMFNTLGNFVRHPRAGLTVLDVVGHRQIQLSGEVAVDLDGADTRIPTGGTRRSWTLRVRGWRAMPLPTALALGAAEFSRFNPAVTPSETDTP